jgi:hypothetical protein
MATSDPRMGQRVLDALIDAGIGFAVLHGEPDIAAGGSASDVDIVIDRSPDAVIRASFSTFAEADLLPVMYWPYDIGGAASVFFTGTSVAGGAQVDMLFDPKGIGKEALRTTALLDAAVAGTRWRRVDPIDELIYLARKRHRKGQAEKLHTVLAELVQHPRPQVRARLDALVPSRVAEALEVQLDGADVGVWPPKPTWYWVRSVGRLGGRVLHPIGMWASVPSETVATELAARFSGFIPYVETSQAPETGHLAWWVRNVPMVRWRPGLFLSWPQRPARPRADAVLADVLASELASAMVERVRRLIS